MIENPLNVKVFEEWMKKFFSLIKNIPSDKDIEEKDYIIRELWGKDIGYFLQKIYWHGMEDMKEIMEKKKFEEQVFKYRNLPY